MKLSQMKKKGHLENVIGFSGEELPEVFTAHPFPSLKKKDGIFITQFAEPLLFDERLNVIDLFSGCGGLSLGLVQAGLRIVASVENDTSAHLTYVANIPT